MKDDLVTDLLSLLNYRSEHLTFSNTCGRHYAKPNAAPSYCVFLLDLPLGIRAGSSTRHGRRGKRGQSLRQTPRRRRSYLVDCCSRVSAPRSDATVQAPVNSLLCWAAIHSPVSPPALSKAAFQQLFDSLDANGITLAGVELGVTRSIGPRSLDRWKERFAHARWAKVSTFNGFKIFALHPGPNRLQAAPLLVAPIHP